MIGGGGERTHPWIVISPHYNSVNSRVLTVTFESLMDEPVEQ